MTVVEPVMVEGIVVSSTEVRRAIVAGDVERAGRLLGYSPIICGRLNQGQKRSRKLGLSTANLLIDENQVTPDEGLFQVRASFPGGEEPGMLAISQSPCRPDNSQVLEVHLLNARGDELNGAELDVRLLKKLRAERSTFLGLSLRGWMKAEAERMSRARGSLQENRPCA